MAQKNRGLMWVALIALLLFLAWLGNYYGWWSLTKNGTSGTGIHYGTPTPRPTSQSNTTVNNFYSTTYTGESKQQVTSDSQQNGLTASCSIAINGTQVCLYSSKSGTGSVIVNYQDGKVTGVTNSSF